MDTSKILEEERSSGSRYNPKMGIQPMIQDTRLKNKYNITYKQDFLLVNEHPSTKVLSYRTLVHLRTRMQLRAFFTVTMTSLLGVMQPQLASFARQPACDLNMITFLQSAPTSRPRNIWISGPLPKKQPLLQKVDDTLDTTRRYALTLI